MTKIEIAVLATVILFVFVMALRTWRRAMDQKRYLEENMKASKASFAREMAEHEKRTAGNLHKVPSPSKPEGMQPAAPAPVDVGQKPQDGDPDSGD